RGSGRLRERKPAREQALEALLRHPELQIAPRVVLGKSGGVREELADRDATRIPRWIAQLAQLGQVLLRRIVEQEFPRVAQLQNAHGGEALGQRSDAEDGIEIRRFVAPDFALAPSLRPADLAVDHQRDHHSGRLAGAELLVEQLLDLRQCLADLASALLRVGELWRRESARRLLRRRDADRRGRSLARGLPSRGAGGTDGKRKRAPDAPA